MSYSQKYTVNYKTFNQLMADIEDDISSISEENYISPDKFIKVVQTCNSNLSVKINPSKDDIIEIENFKGKLPVDFKLLNSAYVCTITERHTNLAAIKLIEYTDKPRHKYKDIQNSCSQIAYIRDSKGLMSFIVQSSISSSWYVVKQLLPLRISDSKKHCSSTCSLNENLAQQIKIVKEKDNYYIITNFSEGAVYISYTSEMIDEEGNLLLLDHPLTTEYYEYAIKEKIYEALWLNGLEEVQNKLAYLKENHRQAKLTALSFVRMCDFAELKEVYFDNRKIFRMKYDRIIQ